MIQVKLNNIFECEGGLYAIATSDIASMSGRTFYEFYIINDNEME